MSLFNQIFTLQGNGGTGEGGGLAGTLMTFLPIILMIAIFYFIGIRPQKKQEKEANEMRNNLAVGDEITTIGGIIGKVVNRREDAVIIETGSDRVKMKIALWAIRSVDKKVNDVQESKPATFKVKK